MRPSIVLNERRDAVKATFGRYPVANPRVFGSVARGEDTDESDVDFLVDALPGCSLFDLGGLYSELDDMLGLRIDLVLQTELPRRIRDRVLGEAKVL
jgi:predicted nucleotidyltransferase